MRFFGLLLAVAPLLLAAPVEAAPKADIVVVWAPGFRADPVAAAAKRAGAAFVNQSPSGEAAAQIAPIVASGIAAFDALELDKAWQLLEQARSEAVRTGGASLTRAQLSDLFLYRGLIKIQQGDSSNAWEELIAANTIDPSRELDPARFSPKVRAEFDRAREAVNAKTKATLKVDAAPGCSVYVDGIPAPGPVSLIVGAHWINGTCPDSRPDGYRLELTADITFPFHPAPYPLPTDTDMLAQARAAGSGLNAFVAIEVRSGVATARLVGIDGRERDRKTVNVKNDLEPVADALTELLTPPPERRWYQSKAVWVTAGAIAAALIAVPVTAALSGDSGPTSANAKFKWGTPPW